MTKNRLRDLSILSLMVLIFSCNTDDNAATTPEAAGGQQPTPATTITVLTPDSSQPAKKEEVAVKKEAVKLNPAHGEPGHRCDIEVGAPLNSPPGKTTTHPEPETKPDTKIVLNPAHGEPGHRCDIAVGAPLNAATTKNNTSGDSSVISQIAKTVAEKNKAAESNKISQSTTNDKNGKLLINPAHGQPGHRCEIAVGAPFPLDSVKKKDSIQ